MLNLESGVCEALISGIHQGFLDFHVPLKICSVILVARIEGTAFFHQFKALIDQSFQIVPTGSADCLIGAFIVCHLDRDWET